MVDLIPISEELSKNLSAYIAFIGSSLAGIALVGTFSMALVQAFKRFPRYFYFKYRLVQFVLERVSDEKLAQRILKDIYTYSAGNERAFYSQKLTAIVQGLNSFTNLAISFPEKLIFNEYLKSFDADITDQLTAKENATENRAKLSQLIKAYIEGFNIEVQRDWTYMQQLTSVAVSILLIIVFAPIENTFVSLLYGVIGGFIAPFAHDFMVKIKPAK